MFILLLRPFCCIRRITAPKDFHTRDDTAPKKFELCHTYGCKIFEEYFKLNINYIHAIGIN